MKVINPIGRKVETDAEANYEIQACMCATGLGFSSTRGTVDACGHCGCSCLPFNHDANSGVAVGTARAS